MTQAASPGSDPPPKLFAAAATRLRLAIASCAVLGLGALSAPTPTSGRLPTAEQKAAPLLEEQVLTREVVRPFRGVDVAADQIRRHVVAIVPRVDRMPQTLADVAPRPGEPPLDGFGAAINGEHILTHADALARRSVVQMAFADGGVRDGRVAAFEPSSGLVLLRAATPATGAAPIATEPLAPGTLAVAVGLAPMEIVMPVFVAGVRGDRYELSGVGTLLPGMPIFTLDGTLVAIAGDSPDTAYAARAAVDRLVARAARGERLGAAGIELQSLTGQLTAVLGDRGALISGVIEGSPASEAQLSPGDVVTHVGDVEVASADAAFTALRAAAPGVPIAIQVKRQRQVSRLELTPGTAYEVAVLARAQPEPAWPPAGTLLSTAQLESSGIPATAGIVAIDGRAVATRALAQRLLARRSPGLVLVRHDGRQFFAVVGAPR
jgi:hypothetical protein